MVRDTAQLFTIEGIAASLIMLLTAFFVINATTVYTAGDSHISDMQLETLGSDVLKMMDTRSDNYITKTPLQMIIENPVTTPNETFKALFLGLANNRTGLSPDYQSGINSSMNAVQFTASYSCRNSVDNSIGNFPVSYSRNMTGGEHAVRATKWVTVNKAVCGNAKQDRAVLVEVLMWRD